eukprot:COSAG01_NODE_14429_length_1455_cov_0.819322_2_plen_44_part_01
MPRASIGGAEEGGGLELAVLTRLPTVVVGAGGGSAALRGGGALC